MLNMIICHLNKHILFTSYTHILNFPLFCIQNDCKILCYELLYVRLFELFSVQFIANDEKKLLLYELAYIKG